MSSTGIIGFLVALAIAGIVAGPCAKLLRKHPSPFYLAAIAMTAVYCWAVVAGANFSTVRPLAAVMQRGYLAVVFLGIVMFTGVFDEGGAARKHLQPIRGELSILSFIFIVGHLFTYLPGYLPLFGMLTVLHGNVAASLVVAVILTVVFCALSVMSLRVIRTTMNRRVWKSIQRASYVMVFLLIVHVGLVLGTSAVSGGAVHSIVSFVAYVVVVVLYVVLRLRKASRDRTGEAA